MRRSLPLAAIGTCVLIELVLLRVGIDDLDEGYFAAQAWRVAHGQVPLRDFETLYSPGLAYLHAALGANLLAMRALSLLARAGLAVTMYAIARPLVRNPLWAAAPGLFLLIGLDDAPERWEPHPGWLSSLFAILAAWTVCKNRSLALAGALCALSYLFKQNTGLFMLIAVLVWTRRPIVLASFAATTALWLVPLAFTVGDLRSMGVLVGAVNQAGLVSAPELTMLVPLACLIAAWRFAPRWYLLAGVALFATQYPRMDTLHLAWSAPLLLVLGAAAVDRAKPHIAVLALVVVAVLASPIVAARTTFVAQPRAPIAGVEAPVQTAHDLSGVVADIQQRTAPGEAIFVYPSSPLLYALADRPNATRFDHLNPGAATSAQIDGVIRDLEMRQPKAVVISDFWEAAWGDPGDNAPLEHWLASHFVDAARYGAYRVLVPR